MKRAAIGLIAAMLALSACSTVVPQSDAPETASSSLPVSAPSDDPVIKPVGATVTPAVTAPATTSDITRALDAGIIIIGTSDKLRLEPAQSVRALGAFKTSCPGLLRRADGSGLTQNDDWRAACTAATATKDSDASRFFASQFTLVQIADGKMLATGYFEPEIAGAKQRDANNQVPVYAKPADLVEVDLGQFSKAFEGKKIRGRFDGTTVVPYYDRTQIEEGALSGKGLEIAWAADPVELFFLQIQGSGRIRTASGEIIRIGYASQNGHDYTGIGRLLLDRKELQPGQATMQGIMAWIRANPEKGLALMRENRSYVFFQILTGPGPLGAMGYPVVGRASVAVDPKFVPLGAPIFLSSDRTDVQGIWVAQDTGGAIKGSNRVDTFWGAGAEARAIAGGMAARGTAWLLLPNATVERLKGEGRAQPSVE